MDSCKDLKSDMACKLSLIERRSDDFRCEVTACKRLGTFLINKCYHDVCGGCLRLEERFFMDGNETKKNSLRLSCMH